MYSAIPSINTNFGGSAQEKQNFSGDRTIRFKNGFHFMRSPSFDPVLRSETAIHLANVLKIRKLGYRNLCTLQFQLDSNCKRGQSTPYNHRFYFS